MNWEIVMSELESAEDFLEFFGVGYTPEIVEVNRLQLLKRYHDYLTESVVVDDAQARRSLYAQLLARSYDDVVKFGACEEKFPRVLCPRKRCSVLVAGP